MSRYLVLEKRLFLDWLSGELSQSLTNKSNLQVIRGPVSTQNVGQIVQSVMETSSFGYMKIPIAVYSDLDLRARALKQLVTYLPWDELNRTLSLDKITTSGLSAKAGLTTTVGGLLEIDAKGGIEDTAKKQRKLELVKKAELTESFQIIDVVNLFFEWSKAGKLLNPWDAVFFYLQVPRLDPSTSKTIFEPFLSDIALDTQKRVFSLIMPENRIDFKSITTNLQVTEYELRFDHARMADEMIELARRRLTECGRIRKHLEGRYRELNKFLNDSQAISRLPTMISERGYDLAKWNRQV